MRKVIVLICMVMLSLSGYGQYNNPFVVKGKINGIKQPMDVILEYRGEKKELLSNDGTFEFRGTSFPTDATLKTLPHHPTLTMLDTAYWVFAFKNENLMAVRNIFLEGNVMINGKKSLNDAVVTGSKEQLIYEEFRAKEKVLVNSLNALREKGRNEDEEDKAEDIAPKQPSAEQKDLQQKLTDLKLDFITRNPNSYFSLDLAKLETRGDNATLERMVNLLGKPLQGTTLYKSLKTTIKGQKINKIGDVALDFTQQTPDGTPISLASYKGKYVLLDFWASWCVPCRAENPNVLAAYNKYKSRNFDVLSVSIDSDKNAWVKAVREDKLPWVQISDLKGGNNAAAVAYAVKGVPQNFLIDPSGKVIAKDLHGEELQKTLEQMLK